MKVKFRVPVSEKSRLINLLQSPFVDWRERRGDNGMILVIVVDTDNSDLSLDVLEKEYGLKRSTLMPAIERGDPLSAEDFKIVLSFAGRICRQLRRPATSEEIRTAWLKDKIQSAFGNPDHWNLKRVAAKCHETWRPAPAH